MRTRHFLAGFAVLLFTAQASVAATLPNVNETGFGRVGQGAPGIGSYDPANQQDIQDVACGPTSVYNSFVYLQNNFAGLGNLILPGNASNTINQLAQDMALVPKRGVSEAGFIAGKTKYIRDRGLQNSISIESNDDAATMLQFIYDQLAKGQDVEIGMLWNGGGGHIVQVTGMDNFDPAAQTGTLNFNDPWGNSGFNGVPDAFSSTETGTLNGTSITYDNNSGAGAIPGGEDPTVGPFFAGPGASATIAFAVAESPVPLPSTVWGGLVLFVWVVFSHARRRAASTTAAAAAV